MKLILGNVTSVAKMSTGINWKQSWMTKITIVKITLYVDIIQIDINDEIDSYDFFSIAHVWGVNIQNKVTLLADAYEASMSINEASM